MFFAYSEIDRNPNLKRRGIKLFDHSHNQESSITQNLTESPQKKQGRRVSLPEYTSVLSHISTLSTYEDKELGKSEDETSEEDDSIIPMSQQIQQEIIPSSRSSSLSINRGALDKVYAIEKKKKQAADLEMQINEALVKKQLDRAERENDRNRIYEDYAKFQEEKVRESEEMKIKMRNYKAQLDVQKAMLVDSRTNDRIGLFRDRQIELPVDHSIDCPNVGYFSNYGRYTKNSPQKLIFNPITGILKENPIKKNIFDGGSEYSSMWNRPVNNGYEEKNKHLMGYGSIIVQNK